jgi:predicted nucleotidyltransferase component of viral defense system
MISRETLIVESNRTGFRAEILEKVIRLMDLLNAFVNDEFLRSQIALKGGTALNLFHFDLPRLSVDIDLNYVGSIDRETMLIEKPKIVSAIEKICRDKNYLLLHQPNEHAGGKWTLGYKSELVQQGQLEIDLNLYRVYHCGDPAI